jgi:hypothetical protein
LFPNVPECVACAERPRSVVFTGCRHLAYCEVCYERTLPASRCPLCREVSDGIHLHEYLDTRTYNNTPFIGGSSRISLPAERQTVLRRTVSPAHRRRGPKSHGRRT